MQQSMICPGGGGWGVSGKPMGFDSYDLMAGLPNIAPGQTIDWSINKQN